MFDKLWEIIDIHRAHILQTVVIAIVVPSIIAGYLYFLGQRDDIMLLKLRVDSINREHDHLAASMESFAKEQHANLAQIQETLTCIRMRINGAKTCDRN